MSINNVIVSGNATRDIEVRQTASGFCVGTFGIAVNERVKNKSTDQWEDRANFFDVTLLGSRAEKLAQYLTKGTKVCVSGKLRWSQWERDGQKRSKVEIVADSIEFMSREGSKNTPNSYNDNASLYDENIPF